MSLFPGRNQRGADPYRGSIVSGQIQADTSRAGFVDDGLLAWEERRWEARRQWLEADAADFEQLDRRGRVWRDRGSGRTYRRVNGSPLLNLYSPANQGIEVFFIQGDNPGTLFFLKPDHHDDEHTVFVGSVHGYQVKPIPVTDVDALRIR